MLSNLKHLKIFEELELYTSNIPESASNTYAIKGPQLDYSFSSLINIKEVATKAASLDNVKDAISMLQDYINKNERELKESMYILNKIKAPIMFYSMMYPVVEKWGFDMLNGDSIETDFGNTEDLEDLKNIDF